MSLDLNQREIFAVFLSKTPDADISKHIQSRKVRRKSRNWDLIVKKI